MTVTIGKKSDLRYVSPQALPKQLCASRQQRMHHLSSLGVLNVVWAANGIDTDCTIVQCNLHDWYDEGETQENKPSLRA